jgi:hypothetical protein
MTPKSLTYAEHFRWMQALLADPAFSHAQKAILVRLALHMNLKCGRCDQSIETIAKGTGVKARAVQVTLAKAQALDYLIRHDGGGRGGKFEFLFNNQERLGASSVSFWLLTTILLGGAFRPSLSGACPRLG